MTQVEATISSAKQITVPKELREVLKLSAGDRIVFNFGSNGITVDKAETREEKVKRIFAELEKMKVEREKHMTPEQKEFARKTAGWTVNQYHEYFDNLPETKAYIKEKYGV